MYIQMDKEETSKQPKQTLHLLAHWRIVFSQNFLKHREEIKQAQEPLIQCLFQEIFLLSGHSIFPHAICNFTLNLIKETQKCFD